MSNALANKKTIAEFVSKETGLDMKESLAAVDATINAIKVVTKRDGAVCFQNFGTFRLVDLKPHKHRNPQTGEVTEEPAKRRIRFTGSRVLKAFATAKEESKEKSS